MLAEIYSPDLLVTVQNLLAAKKANNADLLRDARTRLERLGIDKPQIDEIIKTGQANTHLKIRSPISGHVIQKYVREGQYVQEGMAALRRGRSFQGLDSSPDLRRRHRASCPWPKTHPHAPR